MQPDCRKLGADPTVCRIPLDDAVGHGLQAKGRSLQSRHKGAQRVLQTAGQKKGAGRVGGGRARLVQA